jgi:hypothetical protein
MSILIENQQVLLFLLITFCLGACLMWAFWELERARAHRRLRATAKARSPTGRNAR